MRRHSGIAIACVCLLAVGCVDRRFLVETNAPGAMISVDGKQIGASPADSRWEYAGYYQINAVAPGYQPLTERVWIRPKWYEYPPFDFVAEVLWPFRIEDVRRIQLQMEPKRPVDQNELIRNADDLRERGRALPPSRVPDEKGTPTPNAPLGSSGTAPTVLPRNMIDPVVGQPLVVPSR